MSKTTPLTPYPIHPPEHPHAQTGHTIDTGPYLLHKLLLTWSKKIVVMLGIKTCLPST